MENNTEKSQVEKLTSQNEHTISTTGLSLETHDNKHGATHMVAPGPIADTGLYHRLNYHDEGTSFDIKQYLSRPTYVNGGNFIDGSTAAIYVGSPTPADITNNLRNTQGVYGVRATVCYRLEIAAAPQAQGIVRMAYEYMPPAGSFSKASYRPVLAQLPGAEVNLRSGSAIEVKVPFVYDRDYWPVLNGGYSVNNVIHKISIFPYAPVDWDTTTVSTPTWTLYRWFEDVEFISKTAVLLAVTPQAGMGPEAKHGKVSTWFKYASQISLYAGSIPSLSSIALPVSWAFDAATKIAAHFGWSKPNDGSYMGTMGMSVGRGLNTCADADFANPMGFYANNEVAALPGFAGNDFDEMALCYITCKPGLVASCVLKASDPRLAIKWTCPVTPSAFVFQSSTGGFSQVSCMGLGINGADGANKPGYFPTPMCFAASFFERWRGDVIFRFKFGTTKFHAGKLLIGYVPGEDQWDGTSVGGLNEAPANGIRFDYHSAIVDLRTTDEYDFVVPYTYPASYCDTGMHDYMSAPGPIPNTGVVFVRLIDPLYGPDNVPQNITMLVEVLSQCGLELAQPITSIVAPLDPTVSNVVVAQSGGMNNDLADNNAAVHATGERILSLKQLAARPYWYTLSTFNNSFPAIPGSNLVYYNPVKWFARALDYNFPTIDNDTVVSRLGCLFALQRGGLIVRAVPAVGVTGVTKSNWYTFFNWARDGVRTITNSALSLEWNMTNQVRIPYYGKNTRMRTGWSTMTNAPADKNATTRTLCVLPSMSADVSSFLVGVAGADDFQLGAFTGVPPCVTLEPNNGGSIFAEQFLVRDA